MRQLAGAATSDAEAQTDDVLILKAIRVRFINLSHFLGHFFSKVVGFSCKCFEVGFMSCREVVTCEKVFHGVADAEILISLINEQIVVIRVLIDDLEYPLFFSVMLDQIKFPKCAAQHQEFGCGEGDEAQNVGSKNKKTLLTKFQKNISGDVNVITLNELYREFFGVSDGFMDLDEDVIWKQSW